MTTTCLLLVGRSTSGKSYLAQKLLTSFKDLKNYVVNQPRHTAIPDTFEQLEWDDVDKIINAGVLFEDVINITNHQFGILTLCINQYENHHRLTPIICLHSFFKNRCHSLIHLVNLICFMSLGSPKCVKNALQSSNCFESAEIEKHIKLYRSCNVKYVPFLFNAKERSFGQVTFDDLRKILSVNIAARNIAIGKSDTLLGHPSLAGKETFGMTTSLENNFAARAEKIFQLALHDNKELASLANQLFQMLYATFAERINKNDFSISLMGNRSGKPMKYSLIDLILLLLSETQQPTSSQIMLYKFICKYMIIPMCFLKNTYLEEFSSTEDV